MKKVKKKQDLFEIIIIIIVLALIMYILYGVYKENKIKFVEEGANSNIQIERLNKKNAIIEQKYENIPNKYLNYAIAAKLVIPKINLQTYVLEDYTKEGMNICPSKFWGPNPNEVGNFCIAGHNYEKENMFNHLIDLNIGDELYLIDNNYGKIRYRVNDIYKVIPKNIEPINQETNGIKEVTLITCVNYSKNRLIVNAIED